jgi:hypothetical protein
MILLGTFGDLTMVNTEEWNPLKNPHYFDFEKMQVGAAHPECAKDEIFLGYGNNWTFDVGHARYKTRRKGVRVIDSFGQDRTHDAKGEFFPIFVAKKEYGV